METIIFWIILIGIVDFFVIRWLKNTYGGGIPYVLATTFILIQVILIAFILLSLPSVLMNFTK